MLVVSINTVAFICIAFLQQFSKRISKVPKLNVAKINVVAVI